MKSKAYRIVRGYCRELHHRLPYIYKEKKRFLAVTRRAMEEYAGEHPDATTVDFQQKFGTVEQLCEDYKDFVSAGQMVNSIQRTYHLNRLLCVVAAVLSIYLLLFFWEEYSEGPIHIEEHLEIETEYLGGENSYENKN